MIEDWLWLIALIIFVIIMLVHYDWEYFFSQRQIKKLQNLLNENNSLEKTAENIQSGLQSGENDLFKLIFMNYMYHAYLTGKESI